MYYTVETAFTFETLVEWKMLATRSRRVMEHSFKFCFESIIKIANKFKKQCWKYCLPGNILKSCSKWTVL